MANKKILFIGNTAWSMYNFRRDVFSAFMSKGYSVCVCAPDDRVFSKKIQELGCSFYDIKLSAKGINPAEDIALTLHFWFLFMCLRPSFIFCYTIKPNIYGSIAAFLAGIPSVAVTTGLGYAFQKQNFVAWISKILYKVAFIFPKKVWFLNSDDLNIFEEKRIVSPNRAELLNSEGVNLDVFYPAEHISDNKEHSCVFLLIARLLWSKGVGEFVEAARILKTRYPESHFALLGFSGSQNPEAIPESTLHQWIKDGLIEWWGATDDVRTYIRNVDCVVLPSYYREGIPRSLLEGAAMGKILITTDSVGCRNTVDDGVTGYLCRPRDFVSLAESMEKVILMNREMRMEMGKAGRKKMAEEFDVKNIVQHYFDTVEKLLH